MYCKKHKHHEHWFQITSSFFVILIRQMTSHLQLCRFQYCLLKRSFSPFFNPLVIKPSNCRGIVPHCCLPYLIDWNILAFGLWCQSLVFLIISLQNFIYLFSAQSLHLLTISLLDLSMTIGLFVSTRSLIGEIILSFFLCISIVSIS